MWRANSRQAALIIEKAHGRNESTILKPGRTFCTRILAAALLLGSTYGALALSEIQREELPPVGTAQPAAPVEAQQVPAQPAQGTETPAATTTPPVAPATPAPSGTPSTQEQQPADAQDGAQPDVEQAQPGDQAPQEELEDSPARRDVDPNQPLPEVQHDLTKLPEPVQRMHKLIMEAAKSGDIEKLRPLLGTGDNATLISLTEQPADPITYLKEQSGDPQGQEILAILEEIMDAGFVRLDAGTPEELYVWPYFFAYPLEKLTPPQKVEIYKILTASDFDEMQAFGNYIFFRSGITPDGRWVFFVTGE